MSIDAFLTEPITVTRGTRVPDGAGGWTRTFRPVVDPLAPRCHWRDTSPDDLREIVMGGQERLESTHVLYLPLGADVRRDDVVSVTGGPVGRVVRVRRPGGPRGTYICADIEGRLAGGT